MWVNLHFKQLLSRIHRKYGYKNFHFKIIETKKYTNRVYVRMHLYKDKKGLRGVSIISNTKIVSHISYVLQRLYINMHIHIHIHINKVVFIFHCPP